MARITKRIDKFHTGMSANLRAAEGFARVQHFHVFPDKLVPQLATEADENKTYSIRAFTYAPWLGGGNPEYLFFGLGKASGSSRPAIYYKNPDIVSTSWGQPNDNEATTGGILTEPILFHYKFYLYGVSGGTAIWRYGPLNNGGTIAFTESYQAITHTTAAPPVHHAADDCAYFFLDNKVYRLNGTSWEGLVLTLPDNMKITSGDALGSYLAISCALKSGFGNSLVYLWDRDSSLSTVSEKIDWGAGELKHIANLDGAIVGVSTRGDSLSGIADLSVVLKRATPYGAEEFPGGSEYKATAVNFYGTKQIIDDKLMWLMALTRDGQTMDGVFSVDRNGRMVIEVTEEDAAAVAAATRYTNFLKFGTLWWLAHSNDGSVNRTNDNASYSYTSAVETNTIREENTTLAHAGFTVETEPLPSGGAVTVKYRKAGETSWTTLGTQSTAGETRLFRTHDTSGRVPRSSELKYRVESTGGAVITAIEYTHETFDNKPYGRN